MKEERNIEILFGVCDKLITLSMLDLAIQCTSFYIKFINATYKILKKMTGEEILYEKYSQWISTLETNLQVRKSWFKPVFYGLYQQAKKNGNEELFNLLQKDFSNYESRTKMVNNAMVQLYKGQYFKAIATWEEMALLGKEPLENLVKVVDLLHQLNCYYEISTFVVWSYTNFNEEVVKS